MTNITFDDFAKVEMKIGKILSAELVEGSEKLLKLSVDFAEELPRQVISGIAKQFVTMEADTKTIHNLVGNSFVFITNLEPRMIMGLESQAMIVAGTAAIGLALMTPTIDLPPGTQLS
jgi:methionine--tRNA ligase beta chain